MSAEESRGIRPSAWCSQAITVGKRMLRWTGWMGLWASLALLAPAQKITVFDGTAPMGVAPGAPTGSYALSEFESHSPFSGTLNPALTLYHVGGRGEAGFNLVWNFQQTWVAAKRYGGGSFFIPIDPYPSNNITGVEGVAGPLVAGAVFSRTGSGFISCSNGGNVVGSTLARIVFETPSGTQIELVDQNTNGAVYSIPNACQQTPASVNAGRGTLFRSTDGGSIRFIADSPVLDNTAPGFGEADAKVSGSLVFPNGVTYRIDNSVVSSIRDRNGNKIQILYKSGQVIAVTWYLFVDAASQIVDALGRTIDMNYNDSSCSGCTTITYPGVGGAARVIQIAQAHLSNGLLRDPGATVKTIDQLFPGTGQPTSYNFDPTLARSVRFADGSQYAFQYNVYGELARVTVPTGGAFEYDFGDGHNGFGSGFEGSTTDNNPVLIYRRLQERRIYPSGGTSSTYSLRTHYTVSYPGTSTVEQEAFFDGNGNTLAKTTHTMNGTPLDALNLTGTGCNAWSEGLEVQTDYGAPNPLRTVKNNYASQSGCMNNPQLTSQTTVLDDTNQASQVSFGYDQYGNVTDKAEYDWGNGAPGPLLRDTKTSYLWASNGAYAAPTVNLVRAPLTSTVYNANNQQIAQTLWHYDETSTQAEPTAIVGHDDTNYGPSFNLRANVTSRLSWLNTNNSFLTSTLTYDTAGNLLSAKDPNGHTASLSYADPQNTYAHATTTTNALGQAGHASYDYSSGQVTLATDLNGVNTAYSYGADNGSGGYQGALDQLVSVRRAVGGGPQLESQTNYAYPSPNQSIVYQDQNSTGDRALQSQTFLDGFGQLIETRTYEDASHYISIFTQYDALGRIGSRSNPTRTSNGVNDGLGYWTKTVYDSVGRATQVQRPDGSTGMASYRGNTVMVTDEAGKQKKYSYDGLGRLVNVFEDPAGLNYGTGYYYDTLDNLTLVSQGYCPQCQQRTFTYDSLSRLTAAANPESGTASYTYDGVGNVLTRTDARNITTTYKYDALDRLTSKTSSNNTVGANYGYDGTGVPYGLGHLTSVTTANTANSYTAFDALGRVTASKQSTFVNNYAFAYAYNLADALTSETYPSGRVVITGYDGANRPVGMTGTQAGQSRSYVTGLVYAPHGGPTKETYGNQITRTWVYNNRLQPSSAWDAISDNRSATLWMDSTMDWGGAKNNGTLLNEQIFAGGPALIGNLAKFNRHYTYDGLNRLQSASEDNNWSRNYSYDPWGAGNQWLSGATGINPSPLTPQSVNNIDLTKNRLVGNNAQYDNAGNQIQIGAVQLSYNADNQQSSSLDTAAGTGTVVYVYDGLGQRVAKAWRTTSNQVLYVYDALGQLTAEYQNKAASAPACAPCYLSYDPLGSVRMVTNASAAVIARHDYLPFGEEIYNGQAGRDSSYGAADGIRQRFTGQERDGETTPNLDYFPARRYSGEQGRFLSPDPANAGADLLNPQSWNGYSYVGNNPLNSVDPSGLDCVTFDNGTTGDNGVGTPCPGSQDPDQIQVNGGSSAPVGTYAWWMNGGWRTLTGTTPAYSSGGGTGGNAQPPASQPQKPVQSINLSRTGTPVMQQACINNFYDSKPGKVVEFGSVLSMLPGWGPNPGKSAAENVFLTGGKLVALRGLQNMAANQAVPSVITGVSVSVASPLEGLLSTAAGKILGFAEGAGPLGVGAATVADIMAHGTCAMQADPSLADAALRSIP